MQPRIIVVGAGIVGAAIAHHLAQRGASVTIIDAGGSSAGATARSFAWINAWSGASQPYAHLRHHSLQEYRRLHDEFGDRIPINWSGTLVWKQHAADTQKRAREQAAAGYDVRLVGPDEFVQLEPNYKKPPQCAAYAAGEGSVEPVETARLLLRSAQDNGARLLKPAKVESLLLADDRVTGVRMDGTNMESDVVVLAAGAATNALAAQAGVSVPLEPSPALLARFRTSGPLLRTVVISPELEIRQISDGTVLAATDYIDDSEENGPEAVARRILSKIRTGFEGGETVQADSVQTGWRPMPADGLPIVGFAPGVSGLYLSVMHSGITLAPAVGRFAAVEILDEIEVRLLDICRPERFGASQV
ncbi:MAG: FAD-binding oxidoreductase [Pseudomonadota bacterium]